MTFSYRDRLEGKPVHDEQGTYDRPFFLTCHFDPQKIDGVLEMLGGKPWLGHRPRLTMLVVVHGRTNSGILSSDGAFDPDMREALANAARRYGLTVGLPSIATLQSNQIGIDTAAITPGDQLLKVADLSGGELPLVGDLQWSDAALGWVAVWSLDGAGAATAGPSAASIMTKRFGTPFGARPGPSLATASPETQRPAVKDNMELGAP